MSGKNVEVTISGTDFVTTKVLQQVWFECPEALSWDPDYYVIQALSGVRLILCQWVSYQKGLDCGVRCEPIKRSQLETLKHEPPTNP